MRYCCFSGHRVLPDRALSAIRRRLKTEVEQAYRQGFTGFYAGGALGFDTLAAECVLQLRAKHPEVQLLLALPCPQQSERWSASARRRYDSIRLLADEVYYASDTMTSGCMGARNRYMVDHSELLLCYLTDAERGGTASTVKYALSLGRHIINLAI